MVPQEGIFGNELGLAADRVLHHAYMERACAGFEAVPYTIADLGGEAEDLGSEATAESEHGADRSRKLAVRSGG